MKQEEDGATSLENLTRLFEADARKPRVPAGQIVYAVGDIHGRLDLLNRMLALIRADAEDIDVDRRTIVFLGDYVDRGPESKGVIDRLLAGPPEGFEQVCLMGNHESWLLDFLVDCRAGAGWIANGGGATLESYGAPVSRGLGFGLGLGRLESARSAFVQAMPEAHRAFLSGLELMWRSGDYAFVHAGVRPGLALDDQDPQDLLWIRRDFLEAEDDFGAVVVHGHTIVDAPDERANRIGLDTGAFATGRLTCLALDGTERRFLRT